MVRGVGGDQGGAVAREDGGVGARVAAEPGGVGAVLACKAGEEEGELGLLGVGREADEGAGDVGLELGCVLDVRDAAADAREGEVTARGLEAGDLDADLLDGAEAQAVLLLQALEVVVAGDEALVDVDGGVEALDEDLEVPGKLHDGVVRGADTGGAIALGRCGSDEEKAAQDGEEAHFDLGFFSFSFK